MEGVSKERYKALKKVLLIGDSIRLDYGPYVEEYISPEIQLFGKPGIESAYRDLDTPAGGNGGDSGMVFEYVNSLSKSRKLNFDYFVFNCGLHDIKRDKVTKKLQIGETEYERNLKYIFDIMKVNSVKAFFINTTPADIARYPADFSFVRYNEDVIRYNEIAESVMKKEKVGILDLYSFTLSLGLTGDDLFRDHTHFQEYVIKMQAAYVAGAISAI